MLPNCASQSPYAGDGNLLGHHVKMLDVRNTQVLRRLARGSQEFFPIFIFDAGFQVFGNVSQPENKFLDFRELAEQEGAVFLGQYNFASNKYSLPYPSPFISLFFLSLPLLARLIHPSYKHEWLYYRCGYIQ